MREIHPQESYPPNFMQGLPFGRFVARWRSRDGKVWREVEVPMIGTGRTALRAAETEARSAGWPGHPGGWWDYLKDDLRMLWHRPA